MWASEQFTDDVLTTAIENGGMGFFTVDEYQWENMAPGTAYAVVSDKEEEDGATFRIDRSVILHGLSVILHAEPRDTEHDGPVLHNATTGERLYMSKAMRANILTAVFAEDGDGYAGDIDAVDALAIVECGLFGRVMYA
jgi:hypothetical protein